ncbi:MAG: DUF4976 domain-containing protein [Phycisphaerales bacterium]|nr:DUF4976 domain-containing protein [Phycisphaerales bacterium]
MDLNATIADYAGIGVAKDCDARSLRPVLEGKSDSHRESVLIAENNYRAIVTNQWKYIDTYNDCDELYDRVNDPKELNNCAQSPSMSEIVKSHQSLLAERVTEGAWLR